MENKKRIMSLILSCLLASSGSLSLTGCSENMEEQLLYEESNPEYCIEYLSDGVTIYETQNIDLDYSEERLVFNVGDTFYYVPISKSLILDSTEELAKYLDEFEASNTPVHWVTSNTKKNRK